MANLRKGELVWARVTFPNTWWPGVLLRRDSLGCFISFFNLQTSRYFHPLEICSFEHHFKLLINTCASPTTNVLLQRAFKLYGQRLLNLNPKCTLLFQPPEVLCFVRSVAVSPWIEDADFLTSINLLAQIVVFRRHCFNLAAENEGTSTMDEDCQGVKEDQVPIAEHKETSASLLVKQTSDHVPAKCFRNHSHRCSQSSMHLDQNVCNFPFREHILPKAMKLAKVECGVENSGTLASCADKQPPEHCETTCGSDNVVAKMIIQSSNCQSVGSDEARCSENCNDVGSPFRSQHEMLPGDEDSSVKTNRGTAAYCDDNKQQFEHHETTCRSDNDDAKKIVQSSWYSSVVNSKSGSSKDGNEAYDLGLRIRNQHEILPIEKINSTTVETSKVTLASCDDKQQPEHFKTTCKSDNAGAEKMIQSSFSQSIGHSDAGSSKDGKETYDVGSPFRSQHEMLPGDEDSSVKTNRGTAAYCHDNKQQPEHYVTTCRSDNDGAENIIQSSCYSSVVNSKAGSSKDGNEAYAVGSPIRNRHEMLPINKINSSTVKTSKVTLASRDNKQQAEHFETTCKSDNDGAEKMIQSQSIGNSEAGSSKDGKEAYDVGLPFRDEQEMLSVDRDNSSPVNPSSGRSKNVMNRKLIQPVTPDSAAISKYDQQPKAHSKTLIIKFPPKGILPSKEEVVKKFNSFGIIDCLNTKVNFYTGTAVVVFLHRLDAMAAYQFAIRRKIFGEGFRCWFAPPEHNKESKSAPEMGTAPEFGLRSCLRKSRSVMKETNRRPLKVSFLLEP